MYFAFNQKVYIHSSYNMIWIKVKVFLTALINYKANQIDLFLFELFALLVIF